MPPQQNHSYLLQPSDVTINNNCEPEYMTPLEEAFDDYCERLHVAKVLCHYRIKTINTSHEADAVAAKQNTDNEKAVLMDKFTAKLQNKVKSLEEERDRLTMAWSHNTKIEKRIRRMKETSRKRKRRTDPIVVEGPYIAYCLEDKDIIDDWTKITKSLYRRPFSE